MIRDPQRTSRYVGWRDVVHECVVRHERELPASRILLQLKSLYLHNDDLHAENLVFSAGFICDVRKLVDFGRIHLLEEATTREKSLVTRIRPIRL